VEETTAHGVALNLPLGAREAVGEDSGRSLRGDDLLEAARDVIQRFNPTHLRKSASAFRAGSPQGMKNAIGTVHAIKVMVDLRAERAMGKGMIRVTHQAHGTVSIDGDQPSAAIRAIMRTRAWDHGHGEPPIHACFPLHQVAYVLDLKAMQTNSTAILAPTVGHVFRAGGAAQASIVGNSSSLGGSMPIVADNIDTLILNVKLRQDFPLELAQQLDVLKEASQDAEEDLVTDFTFAGERLFIKPHGAGKQSRWILHSPSLHLDVGLYSGPKNLDSEAGRNKIDCRP
jgi:hypothetical protein